MSKTMYSNDVKRVYDNPSNYEMKQGEKVACFAARRVGWAIANEYRKRYGGHLPNWLQGALDREAPEIKNMFVQEQNNEN